MAHYRPDPQGGDKRGAKASVGRYAASDPAGDRKPPDRVIGFIGLLSQACAGRHARESGCAHTAVVSLPASRECSNSANSANPSRPGPTTTQYDRARPRAEGPSAPEDSARVDATRAKRRTHLPLPVAVIHAWLHAGKRSEM